MAAGDINPINIRCNGTSYNMTVVLTYYTAENEPVSLQLNKEDVEYFEYDYALNDLYLKGSLKYHDRFSILDKALNKQEAYIDISFSRSQDLSDGDIRLTTPEYSTEFHHMFLIKNMKIVERDKHILTYNIELVSKNWMKLVQNIAFTNNDKPMKQDIFEIILEIMKKADVNVASDFNIVTGGVNIDYITNGNDNVFSIVKYLMNIMFYYRNKADTMKFLLYDYDKDIYCTKDMNFFNNNARSWSEVISFFNTPLEDIQHNGAQANFGSVISFPKTKEIMSKFNKKFFDFSYDTNDFNSDLDVSNQQIANYLNSYNGIENKLHDKNIPFGNNGYSFTTYGASWNNRYNPYDDAFNVYMKDNALVINVLGNIERKVGDCQDIIIDNSNDFDGKDLTDIANDIKNRYANFIGTWYIGRIINKIDVKNEKYRQNLVLFRNFEVN